MSKRIYLDNAATSWPKPDSVLAAMDDYFRRLGAPAGRGVYREAAETERIVHDARRRVAELLGVAWPQRILFTAGCTDALNLAIHGLLRGGDHVVTTVTEHNSVLRPLRWLVAQLGISVDYVRCNGQGVIDPEDVRRAVTSRTKLIVLNHVSNVTGAIQPAEEIGRIAAEAGAWFLLDAAQSLGHMPVSARETGAHLIAAPGHKGLLGPLGVGILYLAPDMEEHLRPLRQGGTGTRSGDDVQPTTLPDRYESGTHNVPGIVGLGAGAAHVQQAGPATIRQHLRGLTAQLLAGLREIPTLTLFGPCDPERQLGVVSVTIKGFDPHEAAATLDATFRIQARPGLQCAPRMHEALGTLNSGGALRFSISQATTPAEIDKTIEALRQLTGSPS